jgi:hypothetical protein
MTSKQALLTQAISSLALKINFEIEISIYWTLFTMEMQ